MSQFCTKCGSERIDNVKFCGKCGSNFDQTEAVPYTTPPTTIPEPPPVYQANPATTNSMPERPSYVPAYIYPKADVGKRIGACLLDGLFATIGFFLISLLFGVMSFMIAFLVRHVSLEFYSFVAFINVLGAFTGWLVAFAYGLLKDGLGNSRKYGLGPGQSYGKKICNLMVINVNTNQTCTKGESALRYLTWIVPLLNIVECIISLAAEDGRRLGDKIANTQVIEVVHYKP